MDAQTLLARAHLDAKLEWDQLQQDTDNAARTQQIAHQQQIQDINYAHQIDISQRQDNQQKEIVQLQNNQQKEIFQFQDNHRKEVMQLRDEHRKEVTQLRDEYQKEVTQLRDEHRKEVTQLRDEHQENFKKLLEERKAEGKLFHTEYQDAKKKLVDAYETEITKRDNEIKQLKKETDAYRTILYEKKHNAETNAKTNVSNMSGLDISSPLLLDQQNIAEINRTVNLERENEQLNRANM